MYRISIINKKTGRLEACVARGEKKILEKSVDWWQKEFRKYDVKVLNEERESEKFN